MLQEMKLEDALKKFLKGRKVLVLYNEVTSTDKPVYGIERDQSTRIGRAP